MKVELQDWTQLEALVTMTVMDQRKATGLVGIDMGFYSDFIVILWDFIVI